MHYIPPTSWLFLGGTSRPRAAPARPPKALSPRDSPGPPSVAKLSRLALLHSPRPSLFSCGLFFKAPVTFGSHFPCVRAPRGRLCPMFCLGDRTPLCRSPLLPVVTLMTCLTVCRGGLGQHEPSACLHLEDSEVFKSEMKFGSLYPTVTPLTVPPISDTRTSHRTSEWGGG